MLIEGGFDVLSSSYSKGSFSIDHALKTKEISFSPKPAIYLFSSYSTSSAKYLWCRVELLHRKNDVAIADTPCVALQTPVDVWSLICSWLPGPSIGNLSATCKTLRKIFSEDVKHFINS